MTKKQVLEIVGAGGLFTLVTNRLLDCPFTSFMWMNPRDHKLKMSLRDGGKPILKLFPSEIFTITPGKVVVK